MTPAVESFAAIRFGYGLGGPKPAPNVDGMLAALGGSDRAARDLPVPGFARRAAESLALGELRKAYRADPEGGRAAYRTANQAAILDMSPDMATVFARAVTSPDAFRERLFRFWTDHFTVAARGKGLNYLVTGYWEDAIRPHLTGRFADLLKAAALHPAMLVYLDQTLSYGSRSDLGVRTGRGLNENLAREILELHTLGVGAGYDQADVREFAELLTGLDWNPRTGARFRPRAAEPGAETVLGRTYGGWRADPAAIDAALDDIARHPDTARHIARKLAVHFVADTPDPGLVDHVAAAFRDSDGDLLAVYAALLEHPASWQDFGAKARQPYDFIVAAMRALGVTAETLAGLAPRDLRLTMSAALTAMGQPWQRAPGPDGWPEAVADWITPQGMSARVQWALMAVGRLGVERDPVDFARHALGEVADETMLRLVGRAESRLEGMALVLASPAFNRR
jgi:uncharacterized protein (DUF1800 family)